jgi:excisionase family DNA binding protein
VPVEPEPGRLAVSIPEAAWLMNVGVPMVWKLVARGELPSFKVGRRRLVARSALEEFIARGLHVPAEAS